MKKNITIPANIYAELYNAIIDHRFEPEHEDDNECYMDCIIIGNFGFALNAVYEVERIDDSFAHEFGVYEDYHYEATELIDIHSVEVNFIDEEGNEYDLTEQFDYKAFWNDYKVYGTKVNDIDISYGDVVVVKKSVLYGSWQKMVYLYTDKRHGVHVCTKSLYHRYGSILPKEKFEIVLPATIGALKIVGNGNYYLRDRV